MKLLVASTNKKKLIELQEFLKDLNLELICLKDLPKFEEVPEDGLTFSDNAILKARGYARQTGLLTLAEDSGLSCDALDGDPGVYSARFAGPGKNDHDNNLKVLKILKNVPDNCRGAHFTSAVAVALPEKLVGVVEGKVCGTISHEIRGTNGFGYDAIFYYPPFGKNFGEVPSEMKNAVSHRADSLRRAKVLLKDFLSDLI